ncbi:MAG: enoyl-CoA hydratase [Armatimonadetes bacterium]|nr:enoyl-CoA hydratase [Armatimonadota bacterium]
MNFQDLLFQVDGPVATVILNRPQVRNSLSLNLMAELGRIADIVRDDPAVRVLILTGAGNAFSAGGDIKDIQAKSAQGLFNAEMARVTRILRAFTELPQPVIAAVNGPAVGAGWSLALACDLIVAAEEAVFSMGFVRVGLVPDFGANFFLPRLAGLAAAKWLVLTGETINAREAQRLGLVNRVVPREELSSTVNELARRLAAGPPKALALSKALLNKSLSLDLTGVLEEEGYAQTICLAGADGQEGLQAFLDKRPPVFKGR